MALLTIAAIDGELYVKPEGAIEPEGLLPHPAISTESGRIKANF
jgi:hypothetical protein